jgi:uncharacterized protein (UPF0248 family)
MILPIYFRLLKWFDENNIQSLTVNTNNTNNNNNNTITTTSSIPPIPRSPTNGKFVLPFVSVNNHNKCSQTDEHEQDQTKKHFMKTVEDVISHIEWDNRLDKRYFRVGYIDHYLGLQEKPFNDLSQTTIISIPKHRIQYFKYANEIIWDKESRTDLMFGSTGSQQTIYDVIKRHENLAEIKHSSS